MIDNTALLVIMPSYPETNTSCTWTTPLSFNSTSCVHTVRYMDNTSFLVIMPSSQNNTSCSQSGYSQNNTSCVHRARYMDNTTLLVIMPSPQTTHRVHSIRLPPKQHVVCSQCQVHGQHHSPCYHAFSPPKNNTSCVHSARYMGNTTPHSSPPLSSNTQVARKLCLFVCLFQCL